MVTRRRTQQLRLYQEKNSRQLDPYHPCLLGSLDHHIECMIPRQLLSLFEQIDLAQIQFLLLIVDVLKIHPKISEALDLVVRLFQELVIHSSYFLLKVLVPEAGVEPARLFRSQHFKCCAYTNSATRAK